MSVKSRFEAVKSRETLPTPPEPPKRKVVATISFTDEVRCRVGGLNERAINYLYDKFGLFMNGHIFHPKVKLGTWDGRLRYFKRNGDTYQYFLPEIIDYLANTGLYEIKFIDRREDKKLVNVPHINENYFIRRLDIETDEPIILRDYQVDAVNEAFANNKGIIVAGTGAGKTKINAAIVDGYGKKGLKTMTIVPSTDLVYQTLAEFEMLGIEDLGEYTGKRKKIEALHVVSTWQALQNNMPLIELFDVVICDEAHLAKGNVLMKLLTEYGSDIVYRFGLTGSLPKHETDLAAVRCALGDTIYNISADVLMSRGFLADLEIEVIQLQENFQPEYKEYIADRSNNRHNSEKAKTYAQFLKDYFPDYIAEKKFLHNDQARSDEIANILMERRERGNVFCLVDGILFGKRLESLVPDSIFVHGADDKDTRKQIYDLFKQHDNIVIIATVHIAGTGLSINRIFELVLVDIGKSFIRVIQTIGRGLRKAHDKQAVNVTDICSNLHHSNRQMRERCTIYKDANYKHMIKKRNYKENR